MRTECSKMPGELDQVFRTLLSDVYQEVLKPKGWKRGGQNFRQILKFGMLTKGVIINFQKSQWNTGKELRFTINSARKMVVGGQIDPNFKENACHFSDRKRPQSLCRKYSGDQWWCITADTNYDSLKNEVEDFLETNAIPWLIG